VQRLQIECRHNQRLRVLYICCILIAGICLLVVPLSGPLRGFSLVLLFLFALRSWNARGELGGEKVSLLWDGEGRWWWRQNGKETELVLSGDSYLSTWMIVLNLHDPVTGGGNALLLFPVDLGDGLFRRLSVRLRLEGRASPPGPEDFIGAK
jgi:hypothetical protein